MIRGWVLTRGAPVQKVQLTDPTLQRAFRETALNEKRPDVAEHYPSVSAAVDSGFQIHFSLLNLPVDGTIDVRVVLADGEQFSLAQVAFARRALQIDYDPVLQPLMVSSLGRSGSSWLMRLLKWHPRIAVHDGHPYESRLCKYYVHNLLKTLAEPVSNVRTTYADELFDTNVHWLEAELPQDPSQHSRFLVKRIERLAAFCQQEIDEVYAGVAGQSTEGSRGERAVRYFAEKHGPGHTPRLLWELYPRAREIVLVRDFRDMFCSVLAFNRARRSQDFGMKDAHTDAEFLEITRQRAVGLVGSVCSRTQDVYVLRYEDLMRRPEAVLQSVFDYLDLRDAGAAAGDVLRRVRAQKPVEHSHRTTDSDLSSIGRWRQDLPPKLRAQCCGALREPLQAFGYSIAD